MTTIISGVIGLLMMPWKQQGGDFLVVIQSNFSTLLGPIIGIMLADYFLVRKCTLNVDDLYNVGGQYQYTRGFNMRSVVTMVVSFGLSLLAGDYSFFAGLAISVVIYVILMKNFTLKKYDQKLGQDIPFRE